MPTPEDLDYKALTSETPEKKTSREAPSPCLEVMSQFSTSFNIHVMFDPKVESSSLSCPKKEMLFASQSKTLNSQKKQHFLQPALRSSFNVFGKKMLHVLSLFSLRTLKLLSLIYLPTVLSVLFVQEMCLLLSLL